MNAPAPLSKNPPRVTSRSAESARGRRSVISVWTVSLALPYSDSAWSVLDPFEQQRAQGYVFDRDRRRFVRARSALRRILAQSLDTAAATVQFSYGADGKPFLRAHPQLAFNVTHSEDLALIALSDSPAAIGVDIESVRAMPDVNELAKTICSREHAAAISVHANSSLAFLRVWTRKEAVSKALGLGVGSIDLPKLAVGLDATLHTSWLSEPVVVMPLETAVGYVASIAQLARQAPQIEYIGGDGTRWLRADPCNSLI